jgi:DNA polymerase-3 subunit chi
MTQVDFYILAADSPAQRHHFACRLAEKAWRMGNKVYIHSDNEQQTAELDALLWSFRNSSFVPHSRNNGDNSEAVVIDTHPPEGFTDVLINVSLSVPSCFSRFERVTEIVVQVPEITSATRDSYRFYRDRGYPLNNHDLRQR